MEDSLPAREINSSRLLIRERFSTLLILRFSETSNFFAIFRKKDDYMELLGKYLANSILNTYLIGVNFSPVFIKLLYEDEVNFDDLLAVVPPE